MKKVSVIRNRGQLTLPDSIRRSVPWANPMSAVTISISKPDEIVIRPHQPTIDWDDLWKKIHKSRAILGKGHSSAVQSLERDRASH